MSFLSRLLGRGDRPRPDVLLDIDYERGVLYLVLVNIGGAPARDVQVLFDRPLVGLDGERRVSEMAVFSRLGLLRPGKQLRILFDSATALFGRESETVFRACVSWRDRHGTRFEESFTHDLGIYRDWAEIVHSSGNED